MGIVLSFGSELRRLRHEAGLSLGAFALAVNYDKGYLSKVERGVRRASIELACRCDAVLGADGRLRHLAEEGEARRPGGADGRARRPMGRRDMLATGTGSLIGIGLGTGEQDARTGEVSLAAPFRAQFDQMRVLGQRTDPLLLLPVLRAQTSALVELATRAGGRDAAELLLLASRFAEYTGWMAQEGGDNGAALDWTREAVELALAGGDGDLASYALVRRALITLYGSDAFGTVHLARQAQ
ncbi:helix-turn-helix domain-containing protein [Streptomyces sp. NPDC057638]|uniref:helix-turn-helix domain-containing protein n=1 Tax=Streptomyces sp. NPDC057638 TaxID=3346190 RepID=UPI0036803959